MKYMKEIAYEGVEIVENDNEYPAADMDYIREDCSTYAVIFRLQIVF
ncbi:hypothetical protein Hanom_Chr16g01438301 [Helianthus anomalus]